MRNIAVFPLESDSVAEVTCLREDHNLEISYGLVPKGYPKESLISVFNEINVTDNFEEICTMADSLWIMDSSYNLDFETQTLPKINSFIKVGKEVYVTSKISSKNRLKLKDTFENEHFHYLLEDNIYYGTDTQAIYEINVPIIFISGITRQTDKFLTHVLIERELNSTGYSTKSVFSNPNMAIISSSIPSFMFNNNYSAKEKILLFNRFFKSIELNENPDVILLSIPGDILCPTKKYCGDGGEEAYLISRAISADYIILNVFYGDYEGSDLVKIGEASERILGGNIDSFNIINKAIHSEETNTEKKVCTITMDRDLIVQKKEEIGNERTFSINDISELTKSMIQKLAGYATIEQI